MVITKPADFYITTKTAGQSIGFNVPNAVVHTSNAGQDWYLTRETHQTRHEMFKQVKNLYVIDIGVDENVATITFDTHKILEIEPAAAGLYLTENGDLSLLNGSRLSDIVVTDCASLVSDTFAKLCLINEFKQNLVFDVVSERQDVGSLNPHTIFNLRLR